MLGVDRSIRHLYELRSRTGNASGERREQVKKRRPATAQLKDVRGDRATNPAVKNSTCAWAEMAPTDFGRFPAGATIELGERGGRRKKRRDQHEAGAETVLYLWLRGAHEQWYL